MSHRATVIACVNQKGGTGKTTTCENLGIGLAAEGKKVLVVDTDPQGSLTIALGYPRPDELPITLTDMMQKVMLEETIGPGEGIIHHELQKALDLLPLVGSSTDIFRTNTFNIFGKYVWSPYLLITIPVLMGICCMPFATKNWSRRLKA